jgi:hypothetical protein
MQHIIVLTIKAECPSVRLRVLVLVLSSREDDFFKVEILRRYPNRQALLRDWAKKTDDHDQWTTVAKNRPQHVSCSPQKHTYNNCTIIAPAKWNTAMAMVMRAPAAAAVATRTLPVP